MIGNILQKEVLENLLGPKFLITLAISMILVLTSVYSGYKLYEAEMEWFANAKSHNLERMSNLGSYGAIRNSGSKVMREPSKISIFAKGVDSAIGRSALVTRDPNIPIQDSRFGLNPIFAVFGELDLAFIVKFILSLFAFLFSYNAISGEKEVGTLKMVHSYPVSKAAYILGKTIGGIIILLLTLILPVLLALIMLMLVFNVNFSGDELSRLGLMMIGFAIYLIVFYLIGMLMSALNKQSALSFLMCLFIWVMSVAVIPKMSVEIAGQISPAPSIDEVEAKRAAFQRAYYQEYVVKMKAALEEIYSKGEPNHEEVQAVGEKVDGELREKMEENVNKVLDEYERKRARLMETARNIARISPTSSLTFATNRVATTDVESLGRFQRSLDIYKTSFLKFIDQKIMDNPDAARSGISTGISVDSDDDTGERDVSIRVDAPTEKVDVSGMPLYETNTEPVESSANAALVDYGILFIEAIVLFMASFIAFLRYDVR